MTYLNHTAFDYTAYRREQAEQRLDSLLWGMAQGDKTCHRDWLMEADELLDLAPDYPLHEMTDAAFDDIDGIAI
jgi:hypothetical protein